MKNALNPEHRPEAKGSTTPEGPPQINGKDYEILIRLKAGDPEAFKEVFRCWDKPLHLFLTNITGSALDAEDISQEAFITLWQYRESIDPNKNIKTYIFLIGKQIAWKLVKERKRLDGIIADDIPDIEGDVAFDKAIEARELEILAEEMVKRMPRLTREVYKLYFEENMTYDQIAERLGMKTNAVRSRLSEARHILKDLFTLSAFMFVLEFISDTTGW